MPSETSAVNAAYIEARINSLNWSICANNIRNLYV